MTSVTTASAMKSHGLSSTELVEKTKRLSGLPGQGFQHVGLREFLSRPSLRQNSAPMRVARFASPGAFLAAAESDLTAAEVENNLILGSAHDLTRRIQPEGPRPYFSAVLDGDRVLMSAFRTQPGKVGVTRCFRPEALRPLAEDAWKACPEATAVIGPAETADSVCRGIGRIDGPSRPPPLSPADL